MNKLKFQLLFIYFPLLVFFYLIGCKEDSVTPPVENNNVDAEQTSSKNTSEVQWINSDAYYYLSAIALGRVELSSGCPFVTLDSSNTAGGTNYTITINYGNEPCQSSKRNIRASGKYQILAFVSTARDSIYGELRLFGDSPLKVYKVANSSDTNSVTITSSSSNTNELWGRIVTGGNNEYAGVIKAGLVFATNTGITKDIAANLTIDASLNNMNTTNDDKYIFRGTGVVKDNRFGVQFAYTIQDSLTVTGNCRYPVSGKVMWVRNGTTIAATYVDFYPNSGECDDIATIIRGSYTTTINLEGIDQ
ncbi:MAG: hypothetical protein EHM58_07855 [Ignavibacteriae bacterium]|nr:MAG: hypothetical protein EHM58_07855 [Ignavibacteriota bacterium]